ncbi:MAG: S1C family serine protease [Candidatus Magasanikbacteria bacterium]
MSIVPPHLPAPVCNLEDHRKWQRIKVLFVAVVFGLFAGATGASMWLGWVWPGFGGGDNWILSSGVSNTSRDLLDARARVELEDRVGAVYRDLSGATGLTYLSPDKKIGEAIFVSSDGWLALYYPTYSGDYKNWRVLLNSGRSYTVQKVLKDNNSNLVYLKIVSDQVGAQFKVVNFGAETKQLQDVYVFSHNTWHHTWVTNKIVKSFSLPHLDSAPSTEVELNESFSAGDLVVDIQGKILGVVSNGQYFLPSQYISNILPSVLSTQKIVYRTLGTYGWFSSEQPIIIKNELTAGYAVSRVFLNTSKLKAGDIIFEVNGQIAESENLWYNIISNQNLKLKVLRKGKIVEFTQDVLKN